MIISAIVASAKNGVIGVDNQIPWYLPADFQYFKRTTLDHHIIMGRNCFESIGRPLPKRTNVVITRNPYYIATGCIICHSIKEALDIAKKNGEKEAFIIGGGEIYAQTMHLCNRIYLTEVDIEVEGTVFFPKLEPEEWKLISEESHKKDEKNECNYSFKIYSKV
jgi:dihydrofolate reductase